MIEYSDDEVANLAIEKILADKQAEAETQGPGEPFDWSDCPEAAPREPSAEQRQAGEVVEAGKLPAVDMLRAALVDSDGLDDIPDPVPLIGNDILFIDSINWMVGKPGHGKSFAAIDMAGCVATGSPWQGYPVRPGRVLYLIAEGVRGVKKRVRAWEAAMGRSMEDIDFLPIAVQSTNATMWDGLVALAAERQYALIVLDTQSRITVGVEENSNTEMGRFVDQAEKLRKASAACVLIVHHIGRNGDTGRGATVLDGALSTIIKVSKDGELVKLECTKNKDAEEWDDLTLRLVPYLDSVVPVVELGPGGSSGKSAAHKMAQVWWENFQGDWISASKAIDAEVATKSTFHRHANALAGQGLVEKQEIGTTYRFRLTRHPG
ncbi:AAA family ATPase [Micromonospora zamorensis]|uniref:AAA family ATPase n=1 Tax=Micromonospora zamorensis TaxID=709883 RepID=UPI00081FB9DB|nr:AAA family ATPase [Micromonospora zamorensis]SCG38155.1 AAA domain-containing protein [Micromonospora zamorensis]